MKKTAKHFGLKRLGTLIDELQQVNRELQCQNRSFSEKLARINL